MRYHIVHCTDIGGTIMADISVPCWNDVNIDDLCAGARLIAFDLDNTLARSKNL